MGEGSALTDPHPPEISKNEERIARISLENPNGARIFEIIPTGTEKNTTHAHTVSILNAESLTAVVNALANDGASVGFVYKDGGSVSFFKKIREIIPANTLDIITEK